MFLICFRAMLKVMLEGYLPMIIDLSGIKLLLPNVRVEAVVAPPSYVVDSLLPINPRPDCLCTIPLHHVEHIDVKS